MQPHLIDSKLLAQGLVTLVCVFAFSLPVRAVGPVKSTLADTLPSQVQNQLREAVQEAKPSLGTLTPSQLQIFEDEVLPQAQRFVRGYKNEGGKLNAQVDTDSIKRYMAVTASAENKLQYGVFVEQDCERCIKAAIELKKILTYRAERRGYKWIDVAPPTADAKLLQGKNFREIDKSFEYQLGSKAGKRNAGYLYLRVSRAQADEEDSSHADEVHYQVRIAFQLLPSGGGALLPYVGELTLMVNDSLETAGARLATDAWTDLGGQWLRALAQKTRQTDTNRIVMWINGPRVFADYVQNRDTLINAIQAQNPEWIVEERYLSQNKLGYVVLGAKEWSTENIKKFLETLSFAGGKRALKIVEDSSSAEVERSVSFEI